MAWGALVAAAIGAGASIFSADRSSDRAEEIADGQNPYDIARANAQFNNVNRYTPFGSVEYFLDEGRRNDPTDDRYSMRQTYSPQMQQLADAMLGIAGSAPATYESQMPSGLRDRMAEVYGSDVPQSTYNPAVYGFGQDRRPGDGQVMEGFNYQNFDEQGNQIADDPYVPFNGTAGGSIGDSTTDQLLQIDPGTTTNQQIVQQLFDNAYISDYDYNRMMESFQNSGAGSGTGWGQATSLDQMLGWLPDNLHPRFRQTNENIFGARFAYDPNYEQPPQTEPDPAGYDQQALEALIQAMQGAS